METKGPRDVSTPAPALAARPGPALADAVLGPDGQPVMGATVCALVEAEALASAVTREPVCVKTEADGRYRLAVAHEASHRLRACAPGLVPAVYVQGRGRLGRWPGSAQAVSRF